ncbi:MAG: hypothetical protein KIH67_001890 [Candidatus Moranbacteria bacterium]|nr:hypothetical protein [Candidatus Moranbacteria bacterium]
MRTLLVSYDLVSPVKNYQPLWDYFKSFSTRAKPLESFYLLKTDYSPKELRDILRSNYLDTDDKMMVIDVTNRESAWLNLGEDYNTWLKNNL